MKNQSKSVKQRNRYVKVSTGVWKYISVAKAGRATYRMRKTVGGFTINKYFTNKALAIKTYNNIK
jgi:hypothetical protein